MSFWSVTGTAVSLGIVHVLTGPDHLSALATLSAPEKSTRHSFLLGLQWGIGHSTGLLVVGIILLSIKTSTTNTSSNNEYLTIPSQVTTAMESLVGIFMIGLGLYGINRAIRKRQQIAIEQNQQQQRTLEANDIEMSPQILSDSSSPEFIRNETGEASMSIADVATTDDGGATVTSMTPMISSRPYEPPIVPVNVQTSREEAESKNYPSVPNYDQENEEEEEEEEEQQDSATYPLAESHPHHHYFPHYCYTICCCCTSTSSRTTTTTTTSALALLAGLLHGVAGPGGILGVLPAVQMKDPLWGTLYLTTFCVCSTLTMGIFAACYGTLFGTCQGPWEFRIECLSASLSVMVGILWLILLSTGKMEDIFGD